MGNDIYRFANQIGVRQRFKGWVISVLAMVFVGVSLLGGASQSLAATKGKLTETMDLKINEAAQEFVESVLDEYGDALKDSFGSTLKPLKSVTKDLTKQLTKVADSPTPDTTALAAQLTASQATLETARAAFQTLVDDTDTFKSTLAATPDQLKAAIDTQLGTKFDDLQTAFQEISAALATLVDDTGAISADDVTAAVSRLTEDTTTLTQAIEAAKTIIGSFGD
ncbi:MAG: type III secretion system translocon subunit SctE [Leptolyngbyaceae cyanobacterium SM2_5_2]|nr:type III secretion system translocon subunit SctE [Leptolyngbyaceae cyanobacterium SM2_5_2]